MIVGGRMDGLLRTRSKTSITTYTQPFIAVNWTEVINDELGILVFNVETNY